MAKLSIRDLPLQGKRVLIRVDFNVPLTKSGSIADDTRLVECIPTIQYALQQGAKVILMSHMGRPDKGRDPSLSLGICAKRLSQLISAPVFFAPDCIGKEVEKMANDLKGGEVLLLENLRFHPGEEDPASDPNFARTLSGLGDFYVNDAFGSAHRAHSSTCTIAQYFPGKAAMGFLIEKELSYLRPLYEKPERPYFAIMGGSKLSLKLDMIKNLLSKVDRLFIGGGMAYTFFKAQGISIGSSICEDKYVQEAKSLLSSDKIRLPIDLVIADSFRNDATYKIIEIKGGIPEGWQGMDIGPKTLAAWTTQLPDCKTLFWNGPVGVFEMPHFASGTNNLAAALAKLPMTRIVGGGDTVAAINAQNLGKSFTHISTGGAASLQFLEQGHLPGIDALSDKT
ncbi:MAG: phosphoglycerate kinase [Verrucomicrobia bacterium]|nr:phosphoglycerate kinase [Verrucomicrobiota bacterium]